MATRDSPAEDERRSSIVRCAEEINAYMAKQAAQRAEVDKAEMQKKALSRRGL